MTTLNDTVGQVLRAKGGKVFALAADATVREALRLMRQEDIGAVVVLSAGRLAGVFTERDYAREVALAGLGPDETRLWDVVAAPPAVVTPRTTVDACMRLMTLRRQRHLPVLEREALVGLVSIGDLVKWVITSQERVIRQLEDHIAGRYPG